jgi:hypothetical protein
LSHPQSYLDATDFEPNPMPEVVSAFSSVERNNPLVVAAENLNDEIRKLDPGTADHFFVEAMTKRLAVMRPDLNFSAHTLILLASLSDRIGVAIFWAYTMMDFQRRYGRPMMVADWCKVFSQGVPTEPEMRRLWEAQKVLNGASDNRIDSREAWSQEYVVM